MYKLVLLSLTLIFFRFSYSQNSEVKKSTFLVKGVYANSKEFFENLPSITKDFRILTKIKTERNDSVIADYDLVFLDSSSLPDYWGFCDGENVFVRADFNSSFKRNVKLEYVGKYSFASINKKQLSGITIVGTPFMVVSSFAASAAVSSMLPAKEQILVLNERGRLRPVSINFLKKECKKNPEIIRGIGWNGDPSNDDIRKILTKLNQIQP